MKTIDNTWTNEYGDRIMAEIVGNGIAQYMTFIATNQELKKTQTFKRLKGARDWLNKFRKAEKWIGSYE